MGEVHGNERHMWFDPKESVVCNHPLNQTNPGEDRGRDSIVIMASDSDQDTGKSSEATALYGCMLKTALPCLLL